MDVVIAICFMFVCVNDIFVAQFLIENFHLKSSYCLQMGHFGSRFGNVFSNLKHL